MAREQIQGQASSSQNQEQDVIALHQQSTETNQDLVTEADDLLAEIDGLLEENAEDFVKGFVQKGGQ
mgnify:CR=1 FL=1